MSLLSPNNLYKLTLAVVVTLIAWAWLSLFSTLIGSLF